MMVTERSRDSPWSRTNILFYCSPNSCRGPWTVPESFVNSVDIERVHSTDLSEGSPPFGSEPWTHPLILTVPDHPPFLL